MEELLTEPEVKEEVRILFSDSSIKFAPHMCITKDTFYTTQPLTTEIHTDDTKITEERFYVINSGRECFEYNHTELNKRNLTSSYQPSISKSWTNIDEYLSGKKVNLKDIFNTIKATFQKYIYFRNEEDYEICALYVLMASLFKIFPSVPYINISAAKNSGKTTLATLFHLMIPNSIMSSQVTPASLLHMNCVTQILDESEQLGKNNNLMNLILNSGYKSFGSAIRVDKITNGNTHYNLFAPRLIFGINEISSVLLSRSINLNLTKAPINKYSKMVLNPMDPIWQNIKNDLFIFAMDYFKDIRHEFNSLNIKELSNRNLEISRPLLSISKFLDKKMRINMTPRLTKYLIELFEEKKTQNIYEDLDTVFWLSVKNLIDSKKDNKYFIYLTAIDFQDYFQKVEQLKKLSKSKIGRLLNPAILEKKVHTEDYQQLLRYKVDIKKVEEIVRSL